MSVKRLAIFTILALAGAALSIGVDAVLGSEPPPQDLVIQKCSICHSKQSYKRLVRKDGSVDDLFVDQNEIGASVHHNKSCSDCHADIETVPHEDYTPDPVDCTRCHYIGNPVGAPGEMPAEFSKSVHGLALENGVENAPRCQDCHGSHSIKFRENPEGALSQMNVAETCGKCHRQPYIDWAESEHGKALMGESAVEAPTCTNCHGEHDILAKEDPRSHTFHSNIPESCAKCHEEVQITTKFGVESERMETFERSFHGIAIRFGSAVAANCSSCHGHHKILNSEDPASLVNIANIPTTCGQSDCHPGAGVNFSIGKVHVNPENEESGLVFYVASFFKYFTIIVISGLVFHILLDLFRRVLGARGPAATKDGGHGE